MNTTTEITHKETKRLLQEYLSTARPTPAQLGRARGYLEACGLKRHATCDHLEIKDASDPDSCDHELNSWNLRDSETYLALALTGDETSPWPCPIIGLKLVKDICGCEASTPQEVAGSGGGPRRARTLDHPRRAPVRAWDAIRARIRTLSVDPGSRACRGCAEARCLRHHHEDGSLERLEAKEKDR